MITPKKRPVFCKHPFRCNKENCTGIKSETVIDPGQLYKFDQTSKPVKNPHLWSNEDPYLYKVFPEVIDGKTVVDTYTSPLGFSVVQVGL